MSTLTEIEAAIERLSPSERAALARWWQEHLDPDVDLTISDEVASEIDEAREQIKRGEIADWDELKRSAKPTSR
ncbi:MAG: hypothetical protein EXS18_03900 [Verrucomicrobiae bacterium]|nr:hypothetical protein [Verrucomicrobiae bacterium]